MLYRRTLIVAIALIIVNDFICHAEEWVKFESKGAGFSILIPGEPEKDSVSQEGVSFYIYKYSTDEQEPNKNYTIFFMGKNKSPSSFLSNDIIAFYLEMMERIITLDSSNRIVEKKSIKSKEGFEGSEIIYINAEKKEYNILKGFIVNGNIIFASILTEPDFKNNSNISKFFNSLELYKAEPAEIKDRMLNKEWTRFESEYGGFAALYPGEPTSSDTLDRAEFTDVFVYEPNDEEDLNYNYSTIFFENGLSHSQYKDKDSINSILSSIEESHVKTMGYTLLKKEKLSKDGYYGNELTFQSNDKSSLLKARFYVVRNKVIGSKVYTSPENDNNENMLKFLNSMVIFNRDSLDEIVRSKIAWKEFKPVEGIFTINLPGKPRISEQTIETDGIPMNYHYFISLSDRGLDTIFDYGGYYFNIPKNSYNITQKAVRNQLLHISSAGFIKNIGGTLLYERPIQHEYYSGVEVAGNLQNHELYVKGRFFVVGNQMIAAYAITTSDFEKSPNFDKYFNSLHFSEVAPMRTVEEPTWERVELKEVACSAEFPGSPKYGNVEADGDVYKGYSLATEDNDDPNTDYLLQYSELGLDPAKVKSPENAKTFLHAVVEGFYQELNGQLVREEHIEQNGYRGVSATMTDASSNMLISVRFFIVKGYRVSTIVYSTPQFDDNPNMRKFFNSIVLPKD